MIQALISPAASASLEEHNNAHKQYLRYPIQELSDLTKSDNEVFSLLLKNYEYVSSVKFNFVQEASTAEKLASLFDAENFLSNVDEDLKSFTFEEFDKIHSNILETKFKDFREFITEQGNNLEADKKAYHDYLIDFLSSALLIEKKTFGNQLYNRFIQDKNDRIEAESKKKEGFELVKPKEVKGIEFVKPQIKLRELLTLVTHQFDIVFNKNKIYSEAEINSYLVELKTKTKEIIQPVINSAGLIYKFIGDIQRISLELLAYCFTESALALKNGVTGEELDNLLKNAEERAKTALLILKRTSGNQAEILKTAADMLKRDIYSYQFDYEPVKNSDGYRMFALRVQEYLFKLSLGVMQPDTLHTALRDTLIKPLTLDANNTAIQKFTKLIFDHSKFNVDVSAEFNDDLHQKLMIIDFILFLPSNLFSKEMMADIVNNFSKLANVSYDIRRFFIKAHLTLTSFEKFPTMSSSNVDFYLNYYRLLIEFVKTINPSLSDNFHVTALFDEFIDTYFKQANDQWIQENYLIVKVYNLFYTQKDFDFVTTFPEFTLDSEMGKAVLTLATYKNEFSDALGNAYMQVTKDNMVDSQLTKKTVEFMSKYKGNASDFCKVTFKPEKVTFHKKDLVLPKFDVRITIVSDKLNPLSGKGNEYVKVPGDKIEDIREEKVVDTGLETQETGQIEPIKKIEEIEKPVIQEEIITEKQNDDKPIPTRPEPIIHKLVIGAHPRVDIEELRNKIQPEPLIQPIIESVHDEQREVINPNLINPGLQEGVHDEPREDINQNRSRLDEEDEENLLKEELIHEDSIHDETLNQELPIEIQHDTHDSPIKPSFKEHINQIEGTVIETNILNTPEFIEQKNENLVIELHNKLEPNELDFLKHHPVREFIDNHQMVVTKGNTQIRYTFVVVTRKTSNCYPTAERRC